MSITLPNDPLDRTSVIAISGSGSSVTLPIPSTAVQGDVLLAIVATDFAGSINTTTPGWVRISLPRTSSTGTVRDVAVFHAFTTEGLPAAPVFSVSSATPRLVGTMFRVVGASQTERVSTTGAWTATVDTTNTTGMVLPATGAGADDLTIAAAYYNANASQQPATNVLFNGQPAAFHAASYGTYSGYAATNSSTGLGVFAVVGNNGPITVAWGKTIANSSGVTVSIPVAAEIIPEPEPEPEPEAPELPDTVTVRLYRNGVTQIAATLDGVQSVDGTRVPIGSYNIVPKVNTYSSLTSKTPFYIAHRGSGDNWPEHTMASYSSAAAFGVEALEVSVVSTSDGVLFCHHDTTLSRMMGGVSLPPIAQLTWAEIQDLYIDNRAWLGENSSVVKPTLVRDVLDAYAGTHVIFIEDKQGTNTTPLLNLMDEYPNDKERFVWKAWAGANQIQAVTTRGYRSWGYFTPDIFPRVEELAPRFNMLGVNHPASDAEISRIVEVGNSLGKPVICWEVHYRWMRDRLLALGVKGMMTSNIPYVYSSTTPQRRNDTFSTGRRAHGDLPFTTDTGVGVQPKILSATSVLRMDMAQTGSYIFGSMGPIQHRNYTIEFQMRYEGDGAIDAGYTAGLWFGHDADKAHRSGVTGDVGGYHLIQRANGVLDLMKHDAGVMSGTSLATSTGPVPVKGQWMHYRLTVTPETISAVRLDATNTSVTSSNREYRGGYFGVQKNYSGTPAPAIEFRSVSWSPA